MDIGLDDNGVEYIPSRAGKAAVSASQSRKAAEVSNKQPRQSKPKGKEIKEEDIFRKVLRKFREKGPTSLYREISDLLAPYVEGHPENILAQKILAFSLIELGKFDEASDYLNRILHQNRNDVEALNAQAYLDLEKGRVEPAINFILDAIYVEDNNAKLKQNLEKLRNIKDPKVFVSMTKPSAFLFIKLPQESILDKVLIIVSGVLQLPQMRLVLAALIIAVVGFVIYLFYPTIVNVFEEYSFTKGLGRGRVTHVTIQDVDKIVAERANYNFKLTDDEIKKKFEMAKTFIDDKKRNRAVITLNELLNSNASDFIKERVIILQGFVPDADVGAIDYVPQVQDVLKIPFLYKDVAVRWSGTIANLEHKERKETVFDLLINFVDNAVVEGIAETHYEGFQNVLNGEKVAVFGVIAGINSENKIIVKGLQVQRIYH